MRELDECTAEVFRRGEKRIAERRRNRNRVLAVCIPACLTAAAWSVMSLPAAAPEMESAYYSQAEGEAAGNAPESLACPYTAVEIQDTGITPEHCGEVTDRLAAAEMFRAIHSLFAETDGNELNSGGNFPASDNFPSEENNTNRDLTDSTNSQKDYTITFTAEDGSRAVYRLSGNTLADVSTNETIILSDAQTAGLMAALGLAE